jgi:monoamine oxidase
LRRPEQNGTEVLGYFDGSPYHYAEMTDDIKSAWQKIHSDLSAASYPTTSSPRRARTAARQHVDRRLDHETFVGGMSSGSDSSSMSPTTSNTGAESSQQSALNLLYLSGYSGQGQFRVFGPSNEKYHVIGGNDQIGDRLAAKLTGQITTGSELVAVKRNPAGKLHD